MENNSTNKVTIIDRLIPILRRLTPRARRLATAIFLANVALIIVSVLSISISQVSNWMNGARDQALQTAEDTATQISNLYADIGEISIASVARTADASLNAPMTAQAFAAAFFVKAASNANYDTAQVVNLLTSITEETVLDEFWITDSTAFSYLTNVRGPDGSLIPFAFKRSPSEQPQAFKFYPLVEVPPDSFAVVTQPAQVREVDRAVYKYVATNGVDHPRIVQVGNRLDFGDNELLSQTHAGLNADVSAVIEGNLSANMRVVGVILDHYIQAATNARYSDETIIDDLNHIILHTAIGEITVADRQGITYHSVSSSEDELLSSLDFQDELDDLFEDEWIDHSGVKLRSGGSQFKFVTVARPDSPFIIQVGLPLVSGNNASILNTIYQEQANVIVEKGYPEALWFIDVDDKTAAAAQHSEANDITEMEKAWSEPYLERSAETKDLIDDANASGGARSKAELGLFTNRSERGLWVATPVAIEDNRIGTVLAFINLDNTASEIFNGLIQTLIVSLLLLTFTAFASFFGARLLTRPIEKIATAARFVESGEQPDEELMESVLDRSDEIGSLARVFQDMTIQVFSREEVLETLVSERTTELVNANNELKLAQESINQDLQMAMAVQAALVRDGTADLNTFSATARMEPALQVGGDFVDFFEFDNSLICVVGDVSGKGVASALFMAASQAAIRFAANESKDVAEICQSANNRICQQNPMGLFVTVFVAYVNLTTGEITYVSAGHEPPYLMDGKNRSFLPGTGGVAMGVLDGIEYTKNVIQMKPNEILFCYTDGLTDMVNLGGEIYGKDRLEQALDATPKFDPIQMLDHVWDDIIEFSRGAAAADDRTCLVLHRKDLAHQTLKS
ncbi:MAG: SpoIIE family protein phosphatase [Bacteroidetes bacterium]|nr:SpoIIE family protein phosphatase [Bacteroidota bacterium]